jgi:hypothetical protein
MSDFPLLLRVQACGPLNTVANSVMTGLFALAIHFLWLISMCVVVHLSPIFPHFLNVFEMSLGFCFRELKPFIL